MAETTGFGTGNGGLDAVPGGGRVTAAPDGELLDLLLEATPDGVMDWNLVDGTVRYTARWKALLGYEAGDLPDSPALWTELTHPEDLPRVRELLQDHLDNFFPFTHTWRMRHQRGDWIWLLCRAVTNRDADAQPVRLVAVFSDITERVRAEERSRMLQAQVMQTNKLESIGQLAAGIAHEINTPMQYIGDNVVFAQEASGALFRLIEAYERALPLLPDDTRAELEELRQTEDVDFLTAQLPRSLGSAADGVKRVACIVQAMKEFAHPRQSEKTAADLNKEISTTVTVSTSAWKHAAELELALDPALPAVPCLPGEINQVVLNLIVNAAHAVEDAAASGARPDGGRGTIRISTCQAGGHAEIRVADTGTGIPEAVRDRIFDPFFTTKGVGRGSGQGLAIARNTVVDKHGGTIEFETELGKGTTFIVRLPLAPAAATPAD